MRGRATPLALTTVVAVVVGVVLWPTSLVRNAASTTVFARGLSADASWVGDHGGPRNIVLSYHPLSHWYTHDALVNRSWPGKTFVLVREEPGSDVLYADADAAIAPLWSPGTDVWCVIPFEVGPDQTARACRFSDPRVAARAEVRLQRSVVVHVTPTP
jgi:hypothetical protein